ncbi:MAG: tRNA 2-selenouridine synthase [Paraglaciecola sp.]
MPYRFINHSKTCLLLKKPPRQILDKRFCKKPTFANQPSTTIIQKNSFTAMKIKPTEIWTNKNQVILDVRTPAEFAKGHIPNALNFPLFSDEERKIVGTIYKQQSAEEALLKGLEFVGPKMSGFVTDSEKLALGKKMLIHCWRGGKRSESLSWLLNLAGKEVSTLSGGYKSYRNFAVQDFFEKQLKIKILSGKTGCGKTEILHTLREQGHQIIDLEGLANHKGSAFGALGEEQQPTTEQFENNLYEVFRHINPERTVWVENENRLVGRVFIPEGFWKQMKAAPLINLERPVSERVNIIMRHYGDFSTEGLKNAFGNIKKRLGGQNYKAALLALEEKDLEAAIKIALYYYDKAYQHYLDKNEAPQVERLVVENITNDVIAKQLVAWSAQH